MDPRFLGLQFHFSDAASLHYFMDCYTDPAARKARGGKDYLERLITSTVFEHENRHFWDSLLSPYYSSLLRKKISAYLNFTRLLPSLVPLAVLSGSNIFPVPLCRWLEMPPNTRKDMDPFAAFLIGNEHPVRTVPMPVIPNLAQTPSSGAFEWHPDPEKTLAEFLSQASIDAPGGGYNDSARAEIELYLVIIKDVYDTIDCWSSRPARTKIVHAEPWEIFEIPAINVQLIAAAQMHSHKASRDLLASFIRGKTTYSNALLQIVSGWFANEKRMLVGPTAASVWSLLGPSPPRQKPVREFEEADWSFHPSIRLDWLYSKLQQRGFPKEDAIGLNTLDDWESALTGRTIKANLEEMVYQNLRFAHSVEASISQTWNSLRDSAQMKNLSKFLQQFLAWQALAVSRFLSHPEMYLNPELFVTYEQRELPLPHALMHFHGFGWSVTDSNQRIGVTPIRFHMQNGKPVATAKALMEGDTYLKGGHPAPAKYKITAPEAFDVYESIFWMDHLFSRKRGDYMEENPLINGLVRGQSPIKFFELL
ncbi:hypothetical protein IAI58_01610 [Roseomonas marmotae]|nr:hypothetical protein IAI58_01610 [Roseomonas marmotae]